jgi:hypothetical protein
MPHCFGVTLKFDIFISHRSDAPFRVALLTVLVAQFTAVLHAGSMVSCHNFMQFFYASIHDLGQAVYSISNLKW